MDIKKKTSTANLIDKKLVKKLQSDNRLTEMDKLIGIQKVINNFVIKSINGYSAIFKISTSSLELLSEDEVHQFENTLIGFSFGLNGRIKFVRSNKRQSFKKYKEYIDTQYSKIEKKNTYKDMYKERYLNELTVLENRKNNNSKANYIYVTVNNNSIEARALKELQDKCNYVVRGLNDINIRLEKLEGIELIETFYNNFNKLKPVRIDKLIKSGDFQPYIEGLGLLTNDEVENSEDIITKIISEAQAKEIEESQNEEEQEEEVTDKTSKKNKNKKKAQPATKEPLDLEYEYGKYKIYDLIKPDVFKETEDYIKFGTHCYCRLMTIRSLPSFTNVYTLNSVCTVEDMEVITILKKLDEKRLSKTLKERYSRIMANLMLQVKNEGTVDYDKKETAKNIDQLRQLIETNADKLFTVQNFVRIWGSSLTELEKRTTEFEDKCSQQGMVVNVCFYDQKDAFQTTLPLNTYKYIEDRRNLTTGGAACMVPNGCTHLSHVEGKYFGRSEDTNAPIIYDPFLCQKKKYKESQYFANPHIFVTGKMGAGKSVSLKCLISRGIIAGEWNAIFDVENEYKKLCDKFDGNYIQIKSGQKTGINPLELNIVEDEDSGKVFVPLEEKKVEITNLINNFISHFRNGRGLVGVEITGVQDAVANIYKKRGITTDQYSLYEEDKKNNSLKKKKLPILSDLRNEMANNPNLEEVTELMRLITGDGGMALFDCQTSYKIVNFEQCNLVVFGLKELDNFSRFFAMTTILSWLWGLFSDKKYKGIQKNVTIDEGWRFAKSKESLTIIEDFSRRGRKYWISLIIATQSINEFLSTPEGKAVIGLCSTKLILKQDASLAKSICDYFGLPSIAYRRLPSFQKGEGILVTEVGSLIIQMDMFACERDFAETS